MNCKIVLLGFVFSSLVAGYSLGQEPVVTSKTLDSTPLLGPGVEIRLDFGQSNYFASQFRTTGLVVDDPTTGSETKPGGKPNPTATPPAGNGANADEQAVATTIVREGYTIINQPPILPTDTDHLPGPPPGKYNGKKPDYRIEGKLFDLYSPTPTKTPTGIADVIDQKAGTQVSRVIVKLPPPPKDKTIDDVITEIVKEVQKKRDTPDTGTRDDLEELWVVKPDGTIVKLFPGRVK